MAAALSKIGIDSGDLFCEIEMKVVVCIRQSVARHCLASFILIGIINKVNTVKESKFMINLKNLHSALYKF